MRWRRAATIGLTTLALLVVAQPATAVTYVGLHDITCAGATTEGTGMPKDSRLEVTLVDPASDRTLTRGRVDTSASGTFEWRAQVSLSGMREVRAVVRRPGQDPWPGPARWPPPAPTTAPCPWSGSGSAP
jgi:hypothetical protein